MIGGESVLSLSGEGQLFFRNRSQSQLRQELDPLLNLHLESLIYPLTQVVLTHHLIIYRGVSRPKRVRAEYSCLGILARAFAQDYFYQEAVMHPA